MKLKTLFTLASLAISAASSAGIGNEANSWESKTLRLQNQIDLHTLSCVLERLSQGDQYLLFAHKPPHLS